MQFRLGAVLVLGLVLVAGCITPVGGDVRTAHPTEADQHPTSANETAGAADAAPAPVIVAVEADAEPANASAYVDRAMTYWANATDDRRRYLIVPDLSPGDGNVSALVPGWVQADVGVRFSNATVACGGDGSPRYFCTDEPTHGPATATISPGLTDAGFQAAVTAAIGRLRGHDEPLERADLPAPAFADPWPASDPVTVRVENEAASDRDFEPLVAETLRWWEARDERVGNYSTDWRLVDGRKADVTVAVVDRVRDCGDHPDPGSLLGCAPVLQANDPATGDERIRIVAGYTNETTLHVLKHEFGHVYGRNHGMAPRDVMATTIPTTRLPEPNASERSAAWETTTVRVHVDYASFDAPRAAVRRQVDRVLAYYDRGAEGTVPRELDFRRVDDPDAAVTIRHVDELDCLSGSGSCGTVAGRDVDADPALEYHTGVDVTVHDLDTAALGWHVGRWLGYGVTGAEDATGLPPAFVPDGAEDRRNWFDRS